MAAAPISTPLVLDAWRVALQSHPDRGWVECLLTGMHEGFRIGLIQTPQCQSSQGNTPSATDKAEVDSSFLTSQCEKGRMLGPLPPEDSTGVITSRMAAIAKKVAGKWRVVVDLSSPHNGHSVNDDLCHHLSHVSYSSTDDAAMLMHFLRLGAPMTKVHIQDAYRLMPIHPGDRRFLGVSWQGSVYVDCQLLFGLATAPTIFNALAEALEWILRSRGVKYIIHYLDDFLLLGHPNSEECVAALSTTLSLLTFLGNPDLNTMAMSLALPHGKLAALREILWKVQGAKCVRDLHQLQSLIGHLNHLCQVLSLGKAFLNKLFPLASHMRQSQVWRLNNAARLDLVWWQFMINNWKGTSIQQFLLLQEPSHHLYTDASGSWGCGTYSLPVWLQFSWPRVNPLHSITLKEL